MNQRTLFLLSVAGVVLLGMVVYMTFMLAGGTPLQICPYAPEAVRQDRQYGPRGGMGPGMMGPEGMRGPIGVFVNSEFDFLLHMIPHHEEAVSSAVILRDNTEREEMKDFAEDIIRTQSEEIEQMTTWLATWYPEKDHDIDRRNVMRDLENMKGEELDQAFLEDMIPHHMEAVMMSQQLISRGLAEHEEVISLARSIRNSQREEIHMMMNWMSQWYGDAQIAGASDGIMMMWIGIVIALVASIVLGVWLIHVTLSGSRSKPSSTKSARELLDMRYAQGELSQREYLDARRDFET